MALTTQDYKAKGTALFASGDYIGAAQEFSHAIKSPVGKKNPATELDPTNAKAWFRRGACEDGLERYNESIQSYERAMVSTSIPSLLRRCESALKSANEKNPNPRPPPNTKKATVRARLLGCSLTDSVVLHSEDQIAYAKNRRNGVGIGNFHTSYEAWMDDNAIADRPLNKRASRLLCRPNTHGPSLVDEKELLSNNFKDLRAEWVKYKGTGDAPIVIELR
ncbi:hypothetical protein B0H13DRAFT_2049575 [Mycena leptocephala]|nr:hypothetical protein B0H13DRAFT_2049575 [Mycena leptocephala]